MWNTFSETVKSMYDSLVRTYTPMVAGAILGFLATLLPVVPAEIEQGLVILVGLVFQVVWYFIGRFIEIVRGRSSKLLTLGLTKSEPVYGEVIAQGVENPEIVVVDTQATPIQ